MRLQGFIEFVKGALSDNGSPSSSRIYMLSMGASMAAILAAVARHLCRVTDPTVISAWMANLPSTLVGMAALVSAPYCANQGGNFFTNLMAKMKGKDGDAQ